MKNPVSLTAMGTAKLLPYIAVAWALACSVSAEQIAPHKIIGNIYYVGTDDLASLLITTSQGHILINSDYEETVPLIRKNVELLGFKFTDIKILLGSHAHSDHMEGDALVKEYTNARVMVMDRDIPTLKAITPRGTTHPIDQAIHDGEEVKLGDTVLTAHLTAGHTKGCTTWTTKAQEDGKSYNVVFVCSVGVNPGYILVNNPNYPQIASDYVNSFKTLRSLPCDVFLASHGSFFGLSEKQAKAIARGPKDPNPYIDLAGYQAYVDRMEKLFQQKLAEQQK